MEDQRDPLGGAQYELLVFLRSGERFKALGGHLISINPQIKFKACEQLKQFLSSIDYEIYQVYDEENSGSSSPILLKKSPSLVFTIN